ncbi:MAG: hypothetical protein HRU20_29295 [Pseudomonadales bacterium]|nr:hypothetical protein [Pseudomonadales bacterium]
METIKFRESLGLFWAITWRWIITTTVLCLPVFYLRTIPHNIEVNELYSMIELVATLIALYISIVWILSKGYGGKTVEISNN